MCHPGRDGEVGPASTSPTEEEWGNYGSWCREYYRYHIIKGHNTVECWIQRRNNESQIRRGMLNKFIADCERSCVPPRRWGFPDPNNLGPSQSIRCIISMIMVGFTIGGDNCPIRCSSGALQWSRLSPSTNDGLPIRPRHRSRTSSQAIKAEVFPFLLPWLHFQQFQLVFSWHALFLSIFTRLDE